MMHGFTRVASQKHIGMKKARPVMYPEFVGGENMTTEVNSSWKDIKPGDKLKLGKPSNRYYQYIFPSLKFKEHNLNELNELVKMEGAQMYVRSILKMKNGDNYGVLYCKEHVVAPNSETSLYAELKNAFLNNELVVL